MRQALELALEALQVATTPLAKDRQEVLRAITAIKEALAQPEQEPVEWGVDWGKDGNSVSIIKRLADGSIEVLGWEYAPHPPQRTWVGLTYEDRYEFAAAQYGWEDLLIAAEAKLKEKNA